MLGARSQADASTPRPAAFLDRDGVLNHDHGFAFRPDQIEWVAGAHAAVRLLNRSGYRVFVVTNQSGIAHGLYSEDDVHALHGWMAEELAKSGAHVDAFEFCPYHPEGSIPAYARDHPRRKPGPGMLLACMDGWPIDRTRSFMIGDRDTDLEAARAAGIPGHLFLAGNLLDFIGPLIAKGTGEAMISARHG